MQTQSASAAMQTVRVKLCRERERDTLERVSALLERVENGGSPDWMLQVVGELDSLRNRLGDLREAAVKALVARQREEETPTL